ncbi:hypothetical protein DYB32_002172 [Aphanomyces invadans]|uniref:Exosome complex exonuclease Rrp40 N-terminal domain-containing protein n=1 Tax=Aphanomyces invadans TaxID=157072 RepID=A0A3R6WQW7_9STRA|nr:hypothetical protein DYB32_002172 [Aphanomyces invadans]
MAEEFLLAAEKSIDLAFKPRTCLPGDDITQHITNVTQKLRLGAGLVATCDNRVVSTNAGVLRYRPPNRYWLDFNHKRVRVHGVVGMIVDRNAEFYRVDIGSSSYATLGMLAFDGASKRNRPNLQPGTLVYCRVVRATKDLDALIQDDCIVLEALGRAIPFELAVGMNGVVWLNSKSNQDTILIANAILNSEGLTAAQSEAMVVKLLQEHGTSQH